MIPLRIAFDMDGTLADLSSAYARLRIICSVLTWPSTSDRRRKRAKRSNTTTKVSQSLRQLATIDAPAIAAVAGRIIGDRVWRAIEATPDFWTTLKPLEEGAIARLYELTVEQNWEVFFITQRPATAGATVQLQTQRWLIEHGFPTPSVIPLSGARGKCAAALHLDYLVDDMPQNCVDVLVRVVGALDPSGRGGRSDRRQRARAVSASAPRAASTRCSIFSCRRLRRAPIPRCSRNSERLVGWK